MRKSIKKAIWWLTAPSYYLKVLTPTLCVLLAAILSFFWVINEHVLKKQRQDALTAAQSALTVVNQNLEQHFNSMAKIALSIQNSGDFLLPAETMTVPQRDTMLTELDRYALSNGFIADIAYYNMMDKEILFSSQGQFTLSEFDKYVYHVSENLSDMADEKFILRIFAAANQMTLGDKSACLAFLCHTPLVSATSTRFVAFFVDAQQVDSMIRDAMGQMDGSVSLYSNDRLVYRLDPAGKTTDQREAQIRQNGQSITQEKAFTYLYAAAPVYQWEWVVTRDNNVLFANYNVNRVFYLSVLGALLLVLLAVAAIAAVYVSSPVYKLAHKYAADLNQLRQKRISALDYMGSVLDLYAEHKAAVEKELFLSNLLWGHYTKEEQLLNELKQTDIVFTHKWFCCCAVYSLTPWPAGEAARLGDWLEKQLIAPDRCCYFVSLKGGRGVMLVINQDQQEMCASLPLQGQMVAVGFGVSCQKLSQVSESARQAAQSASFARDNQLFSVCYQNMMTALDSKPFSAFYAGLSKALSQSKWESIAPLCRHTAQELAPDGLLTPGYLLRICCEQLQKLLCEKGAEQLPPLPVSAAEDALHDRLDTLCSRLIEISPRSSERVPREQLLLERIESVIRDRLYDSALSLDTIADACGVTPSYLIRFYKTQTGISPMKQVDNRRMEKAKELLRTTKMTLRQIVEECGYIDESNFARKFKKQEGLTPIAYRRKENDNDQNGDLTINN